MSFDRRRPLRGVLSVLVLLFLIGSADSPAQAKVAKPVSVFPSPGTPVVSDTTTFSFRNTKPRQLGPVKIYGSSSGKHGWRKRAHSDGHGVSVIPKRKFVRGETIKVYTRKRIKRARHGDFRVRVGRFYGNDDKPGKPGAPNKFSRLHSRPDLRPPNLNVLKDTPEAAPGKIFFAPKQTGMAIADSGGRLVWFRPSGYGGNAQVVQNFRTQTLRGKPVLTYWSGASSSRGFSQIGQFNILNDHYNQIRKFRTGNGYKADAHEFTITDRNTALVLAYRGVRWNLKKWGGAVNGKLMDNIVQEIDIKTGAVLFEWHSVGAVGLDATVTKAPTDGSPWDYFHVNSANGDGNSILVSARHVSTIYRINRFNGLVRWRLRGDGLKPKTNGFRVDKNARFGFQHDAERLPNGNISLFDNGSSNHGTVSKHSSGMILNLSGRSRKTRHARLVKRYVHQPKGITSGSQGSNTILPDGNAFVGWGSKTQMTEFTKGGEIAFDATFNDSPANSYRARKALWSGHPKRKPAIASSVKSDGAIVWASWNGASDIARWKVLSGPSHKKLRQFASSKWKGLETPIKLDRLGAKVRVAAYDRDGKVLGQSRVVSRGKQSGGH